MRLGIPLSALLVGFLIIRQAACSSLSDASSAAASCSCNRPTSSAAWTLARILVLEDPALEVGNEADRLDVCGEISQREGDLSVLVEVGRIMFSSAISKYGSVLSSEPS